MNTVKIGVDSDITDHGVYIHGVYKLR